MAKEETQITKTGEIRVPKAAVVRSMKLAFWGAIAAGIGIAYLVWGRKKK